MHSRARDTVPFYGDYFANTLAVNTMGMSVELPLAEKIEKIKFYIDHYNIVRLISQYEWNIARHDVHQFVAPPPEKYYEEIELVYVSRYIV